MRTLNRFWYTVSAVFAILSFLNLSIHSQAFAANESVLWSFGSGSDGKTPNAGLITDSHGNLFGTTTIGGAHSLGTVFELMPPASVGGPWTESVLWSFGIGTDGTKPLGGLIMDADGNLFGTTSSGGTFASASSGGTVFELTPPATIGGSWTESILWDFGNGTDGSDPKAGLIMDKGGNLFGTTAAGGTQGTGLGTVFKLTPSGGGWNESVLWNFAGKPDGQSPVTGLILDAKANLYGTTSNGGTGSGTVFELTPPTMGGNWTESILWSFNTTDGWLPEGDLTLDTTGNLYGTTASGGAYFQDPSDQVQRTIAGTAFKLAPPASAGGAWSHSILWSFGQKTTSSYNPRAGMIMNKSGTLLGTTRFGGQYSSSPFSGGTVFSLTPPRKAGGKWTETILWSFGNGTDGNTLTAGLLNDPVGNLYGTTSGGGASGGGTVFKVTTALTAAPTALNFSKLTAPSTSKPKRVTLINKNNLAAEISSVTATAPFAIASSANTCSGESIAPRRHCSFEVEFMPTMVGSASGSIDVIYNGASPAVALTGNGT